MGSLILNIGILRNSYEYLGLLIGTKILVYSVSKYKEPYERMNQELQKLAGVKAEL